MRRIAFVLAVLCAAVVGAESLQEWKTPDGKIYFGDRPPAGSVVVKKVQKPIGKVAAPNPPPAASAEPIQSGWREDSVCQDLRFNEVKEDPFEGINRRIIRGAVTHDGNHVVRNVRVCGGRFCEALRSGDRMVKGEREEFHLDIVDVPNETRIAVHVECSVREPA